ncbi:MAG: twin-arginine translocase subunit TatC [Leptospiraceae bacterium]|nr:twin-arginine translocase subunit TatC [Leptospiraceae bacterium]MCP5498831.1 twin-arginine translocase subunit TatC [Leptospiraceae bacterium]
MTIGEHLEELRQVLIRGLFVLGVFIIVALFFGEDVHKILTTPYKNVLGKNATFYQIKMMAPFMVYLKTAVMISILFSFPIQLYFIWGFISPAVEPKHERYGKIIILASTLLFWAGIALCWYSVFEKMLQFFLVVFQLPDIETKLPIDEYYDIFFNLHLIFGIAFQLPIVLVLLGAMGILRSAFLFSKWREVTIFLAIASAFLSPPDWVSMVALLIPLEILFFLSLIVMKMVERKEE